MSTLLAPDRPTFRALVADVAAKAKAVLPEAVNGRVESAVKLVLAHDVTFFDDGTVEVGSSTDPLKTYTLAGPACDCQDFAYGQAPDGWCQHRIAAGIAKRMQAQFDAQATQTAQEPPSAPQVSVGTSGTPDAPQGLGEAPASVNCHIVLEGRQVQLTLRDTDETRLLQQLAAVLQQYPAPQPPAAQPVGAGKDWCSIHNTRMKENHKDGRSWYSHRLSDGSYCKGKGRR